MPSNKRKKRGKLEFTGRSTSQITNRTRAPRYAQIQQRRAKALDLHLQGFPYRIIGTKLHADPAMHNPNDENDPYCNGFPGGYGWRNLALGKPSVDGISLQNQVGQDIELGLRHSKLAFEVARSEALVLMWERLNMGAAALYPKVLEGNPRAQEVWLRNMEMQADLIGAKMPDQINHHVTVEGTIGIQPSYSPQFAAEMFEALASVPGALPAGSANPFQHDADPADDDIVVDAEIVEEPVAVPTS